MQLRMTVVVSHVSVWILGRSIDSSPVRADSTVGGTWFLAEERVQFLHFSDDRLSILFSHRSRDFDGCSTMVGKVEIMEVSEGDINSNWWLSLNINQENSCFIEVVR